MKNGLARWSLFIVPIALAALGCGSDSGSSGGGSASAEKLDPGREATGCFDCKEDEYCTVLGTEPDTFFCAPNACGNDCSCLQPDAAKRHEACALRWSCQEQTGIIACKP